jgi:predicted site-specific integrase-resolvase
MCENSSMKLSDYTQRTGARDETAGRWFRDGNIQGQRMGPHTLIRTEGERPPAEAAAARAWRFTFMPSWRHRGRQVEAVNLAENDNKDLIADRVAIGSSFTAQLYG